MIQVEIIIIIIIIKKIYNESLFSYIGIRSKVIFIFKSIIKYETHVKTLQSSKRYYWKTNK